MNTPGPKNIPALFCKPPHVKCRIRIWQGSHVARSHVLADTLFKSEMFWTSGLVTDLCFKHSHMDAAVHPSFYGRWFTHTFCVVWQNPSIHPSSGRAHKRPSVWIHVRLQHAVDNCNQCRKIFDTHWPFDTFITGCFPSGVGCTFACCLLASSSDRSMCRMHHHLFSLVTLQGLMHIGRNEGVAGLMKGNFANCVRIVPNSAVKFLTYEHFSR